ncbi:MAG TPA: Uma2 family endonuclease, partial [Polyangiales bacterium]|nr:Uma2 family endonuclease [Polyangiales bacterium]
APRHKHTSAEYLELAETARARREFYRGEIYVLAGEVSSDSTEDQDLGEKLQHYQQIASLEAAVLVDHKQPRIELWTRGEAAVRAGRWYRSPPWRVRSGWTTIYVAARSA